MVHLLEAVGNRLRHASCGDQPKIECNARNPENSRQFSKLAERTLNVTQRVHFTRGRVVAGDYASDVINRAHKVRNRKEKNQSQCRCTQLLE